jgi:hypothetical protein
LSRSRPSCATLCNGLTRSQALTRPSSNLCDYLDSTENTNNDSVFDGNKPASATYNDTVTVIAP